MQMSDVLTLADFDEDAALEETAAAALGESRADFLKKAVIGGGTLIGGAAFLGGLPEIAGAAPPKSDVAILNFALTLEFLEAEFYTQATNGRALRGEAAQFSRVVGRHERAHVAFLRKALGRAAVRKPRFDFKGTTENQRRFLQTARVLEDTGVMAYAGQGPAIKTKGIVAAALSIHSVEARHAAWVRNILGIPPAPAAFDTPKSRAQILAAVRGTGFIVG